MYLVIYECNASVKQTLRSKRETNFEVFIKYILIVTGANFSGTWGSRVVLGQVRKSTKAAP